MEQTEEGSRLRQVLTEYFAGQENILFARLAEGLFLYKIMTKGCALKHQGEIHHHYVMKALNFYEDYYPLVYRMQLERVRRFCNG